MVRPHMYNWWTNDERFGRTSPVERLKLTETGKRVYFNGEGSLKKVGERLDNPDMTATLEQLAKVGADDFYLGDIASRIVEDMGSNGGLISAQDLAEYRTTHLRASSRDVSGLRSCYKPAAGRGRRAVGDDETSWRTLTLRGWGTTRRSTLRS